MLKHIRSILPWLAAGIIVFGIGTYFRLFALTHNVASDAYEQGTMLVINKIRAAVTQQVDRQFPDMPAPQRERLIKEKFDQTFKQNKDKIREAFDTAGQQISTRTGAQKHYLQETDSYYFLGLTQEILNNGHFGTITKGEQFFHDKMVAPLGFWQPQTWHPYIGAATYRVVKFFDPNADLMFGVSFTNIVLSAFVLAAFFFACCSLGCSTFPAFIAGVFFILASIYLKRSTFGWYDDDAYSVLFPILGLGFLFLMTEWRHQTRKALTAAAGFSLTLMLYAQFWAGWSFLWVLGVAGIMSAMIGGAVRDRSVIRPLAVILGAVALFPFLVIGIFFGPAEVLRLILFANTELSKFITPSMKDWPDLFIVVGELKRSSLPEVVESAGGPVLFTGALATLAWTAFRGWRTFSTETIKAIILAAAFAITFVLALSAERFSILCLTPAALLFAWGLDFIWRQRNVPTAVTAGILCLSLIIPIVKSSQDIRGLLTPIFNSSWDKALTKLREQSPADSIIDTWWSPGHFIKTIAQRQVNFDGASINGEQGYWINRVYLSQTEEEALGLLRMMNTSSNNAALFLKKSGIPLSTAVPLLAKATGLNKTDATRVYGKILPPQDAMMLAGLTHGNGTPPPSYVLIYQEIVEGNVLLAYLGKWDFKKIEALNERPELIKSIPPRGSKAYIDFIWNLVGGPYRQSQTLNPVSREGTRVLFNQGVSVDTATMTVEVHSPTFGTGIPQSVFYADNGTVVEKRLPGGTLPYAAIIFSDNGAPRAALMDRVLANSLIAKMYYFEGAGLKYFKPFAKEKDLTGRTKIYIYEVDWSGLKP